MVSLSNHDGSPNARGQVTIINMKTTLIILFAFLLMGCSYLTPKHERVSDRVVKEMEENLFEATLTLLEIPSSDPLRYRIARRDFELALARYLQATGRQDQRVVYLEKEGMTLLLPVQVIQSGELSLVSAPAFRDSIRVLWMPIGPLFRGEIVDLKWSATFSEGESSAAALFPDSLTYLSWRGNTLMAETTVVFDSSMLRPVTAAFPAGLFFPRLVSEQGESSVVFTTTSLNSVYKRSAKGFPQRTSGQVNEWTLIPVPGSAISWRFEHGQDVLFKVGESAEGVRSLRPLPGTDMQVLLDQRGFLMLTPDDSQNPFWISDRSWGNRVFVLDSSSIAVVDSRSPRFTLFEYLGGKELHLSGQSPPLEGKVSAVAAAGEGIVVSTVTYDEADIPWSQLYLIPDRHRLRKMPAAPAQPAYPDYGGELVFIPGGSLYQNAIGDWTEDVPQIVWMNVYESLFRRGARAGTVQTPVPNLISTADYDSSRTRWQFQLKPGVRFADGALLTAQDVIASWQRNIREYAKADPASQWLWKDIIGVNEFIQGNSDSITGLEAIEKSHLCIRLAKPIANLPMHLTTSVFSIKKPGVRWAIGTGPFRIVEIQREKSLFSISCERNRFYHRGMAPLQRLVFAFEVGNIIDFLSFRKNASANIRRMKDVSYFREIKNLRVSPIPDDVVYFLAVNPLSGSLSDVRLRRRIVSALDRQVIAKALTQAEAYPENRLLSQSRAAILATNSQADYSGAVHSLTIAYNARDAVSAQIAERLAAELAEIGVPHRSPVRLSPAGFSQSRQSGNYDILVDSYIPSYGEETYDLAQICYRGYVLENRIADKLGGIFGSTRQIDAREIERVLIDEAVLYPVIRVRNYFVRPTELMDTRVFGPAHLDFSRAWMPL